MEGFYQQVNMEQSDPTRNPVTPEIYAALPESEHKFYEPEYLNYRTKKVRNYDTCYECGTTRFVGWVEIQVPVGDPHRYVPSAPIIVQMIDSINDANVLAARIMGKFYEGMGEKTTFDGTEA